MRGFSEFHHFSSSSTTSTVIYAFHEAANKPLSLGTNQILVHLPKPPSTDTRSSSATTKIQAAYRAHLLHRTMSVVDVEARKVQRQETVDAVRREEREKARVNEELMRLLLDAIPGICPAVREEKVGVLEEGWGS
ncbi:unnamed protein product [Linum trigynum]|uniref:BHLH domain-containing protein n=1 Tax=Linum trigynum TaxID=586398 RepID=A0AAV2CC51_9ROSI